MKKSIFIALLAVILITACNSKPAAETKSADNHTNVKHADWSRNAVIYEVNLRQYTDEGTMKAFETHLPRLKELGVDILWFMPIHPISELNRKGTLGSYYAVKDYTAVNPDYGTMDDFKQLVNKAHEMGFKVLIDWVANHTGSDNVWLAEHRDWFMTDESGNLVAPYDWTDTWKLDYNNQEMRAGMIDALKFWVRECDIDGYRCDVAFQVPTDFWNDARQALDSIKPVFMLAEAEHPELLVDAFDMCFNWPLKNIMNEIGAVKQGKELGEDGSIHESPTALGKAQNALILDKMFAIQDSIFPTDSYQLNHITNHDLNSWEGTEFERLGEGVKAFAVLTYTIPGMPLLYTGQETGMDHSFDFFEKDTAPDWTKNEWFTFYQKLNELKHNQQALRAGTEGGDMVRYFTQSPDAYVYSRTKGNSSVLVYLNLGNEPVALNFTDQAPAGQYKEIFTGENTLPTNLEAWGCKVFVR